MSSLKDKTLDNIFNIFIKNISKFNENEYPEFEIRFGTKNIKKINHIDFYNVIKSLLNNDFTLNKEDYSLKIILDDSNYNLRTIINGLNNIQNYCKTNSIENIDEKYIDFVNKKYFINNSEKLLYDFDEYNFRASFQVETSYTKSNELIKDIFTNWDTTKKIFRYIKRFTFKNNSLPFVVHMSIVKMSNVDEKIISFLNIKDSDVFNGNEIYEIEIECINSQVNLSKKENSLDILNNLKSIIKYVLIGLQESNYPITLSKQKEIINNYLNLVKKNKNFSSDKISSKDFIGPSSLTLQKINCIELNDIYNVPNIRKDYTVTDKADGLRKLLFINSDGLIYLITSSMNIQFTGYKNLNSELNKSIIDGEHILHDKNMNYINLFMAFDIYYLKSNNVSSLPLINNTDQKINCRLLLLTNFVKNIKLESINNKKNIDFKIDVKTFYYNDNIFKACSNVLKNIEKSLFEYETDGIIFTPANTGVGSDKIGLDAPDFKITWKNSFKWKPSIFNTIDFLIKFKKDDFNKKVISNLFNDGQNNLSSQQIIKYFTLFLYVGFDEKNHGYINPLNDLLNYTDKKHNNDNLDYNYRPVKFYPTNPSDNKAHICNIVAKLDSNNNYKIYTESGDEIEDNTIIEFKYDINEKNEWRWKPIKVRFDKTYELKKGEKNYGNSYHVANSNWLTIHNPITENMLKSGLNIKLDEIDDDIYYNKISNTTNTRSLRDFHNLGVKNSLIKSLARPGTILIDLACGKAGDLPKWINSKLKFVLGIDLSKDNIENRIDGACSRFLNYAKKTNKLPNCIFLNGNSSINLKSGNGFYDDKSRNIFKALFGEGTNNELNLGKNASSNFAVASKGFNICSIQFAIHYMFENNETLTNFIENVAQSTCLNGYFIGTCYNGNEVFNMLKDIEINDSKTLLKNSNKIWQITKKYNNIEFNDDETCLGYAVDIYQESINKVIREYLVNFNYLNRILENYGFIKLSDDELKEINFESSVGSFKNLYYNFEERAKYNNELKQTLGTTFNMSEEEKQISFLNNYFIYKKVRNININDVSKKNNEDNNIIFNDKISELDKKLESIELENTKDNTKENTKEKTKEKTKDELEREIDRKIKLAADKKKLKKR